MNKPQIVIEVTPDGNTKVRAENYRGKSCKEATRFLETALGKVTQEAKRPEFYQQDNSVTQKESH